MQSIIQSSFVPGGGIAENKVRSVCFKPQSIIYAPESVRYSKNKKRKMPILQRAIARQKNETQFIFANKRLI